MDATKPLPPPPEESTDIFSISDQVLADSLQFVEEIGFGNWGSVWLCRPRHHPHSNSPGGLRHVPDQRIAVKLVHRSKTPTTAARVRSLWNEMKIVRTFRSDPHPAIIPFHSFIITPSYALITMTYLPTLVPVEVDETKARDWFRYLLSGVEFLHKRGVVHNDIKPANILLSHKNLPVLVDFGFAEKYDLNSSTAFHSNLSYGTPEYLSPERARGLPHDTRKSDVWSLGVTFFEILVGRTPFEESDGEQLKTKEDLENYWSRTLRGKWVGSWKMTKGMERMIRRMVSPNADLRYTAPQAMADPFWNYRKTSLAQHRRSSSQASSVAFERDLSRSRAMTRPENEKENLPLSPPGLSPASGKPAKGRLPVPQLIKARSQPRAIGKVHSRKRGPVPPIVDLSPIKASPPGSPFAPAGGKANISSPSQVIIDLGRKPHGDSTGLDHTPRSQTQSKFKPSADKHRDRRRSRILGDLTSNTNIQTRVDPGVKAKKAKDHVKERVCEWEREKQRLREIARLEEIERDRDEQLQAQDMENEEPDWQKVEKDHKDEKIKGQGDNDEAGRHPENHSVTILPPPMTSPTPSTFMFESEIEGDQQESLPRSPNASTLSVFKHNIRKSIDKTVRLYKSSVVVQLASKTNTSPGDTIEVTTDDNTASGSRRTHSERESWEDEDLIRAADSSLPVVRHAIHNQRVAADARLDRMSIWIRNVEKVVEDARQNFASSHHLAPLPPLPLAPVPRSAASTSQTRYTNRSSRLPRKVLAASQIFGNDTTANNSNITDESLADTSQVVPNITIDMPSRHRRATVSGQSLQEATCHTLDSGHDLEKRSPSKLREKSKSHNNLLQRHIAPVSFLEAELNKVDELPASPRLSEVLDGSLFIAPPASSRSLDLDMRDISVIQEESSFNDLTSSPLHVEPYPPRKSTSQIPDTPQQRRMENVYDRFLMATSGVKRLGKGYQSDNVGPIGNTIGHVDQNRKRNIHRAFYSARRPMPAPVSSEDQVRTLSVDELGLMSSTPNPGNHDSSGAIVLRDDCSSTVSLMRRAIKAMVPGKPISRRLSRVPC